MSRSRRSRRNEPAPVFDRRNYILTGIGLLLVVVGFALMRIENEAQGLLSLYVAPLLVLGGYLEIVYAILWRRPEEVSSDEGAIAAGKKS